MCEKDAKLSIKGKWKERGEGRRIAESMKPNEYESVREIDY